jgi:ATP-binding cassette subfamily F protein 3
MLLVPANFLILDEPTNHLDARSKEVLKEALLAFDGTFAIVSHDRDFLAGLITKVIVARGGGLTVYPGSVDDYLRIWHEREAGGQDAKPAGDAAADSQSASRVERDRKRREAQLRQERYRRLKPLKDTLEALLARIEQSERRKAELEALLADPQTYGDAGRAKAAGSEYRAIEPALEALYGQWSGVQEKIDAIEREGPEEG